MSDEGRSSPPSPAPPRLVSPPPQQQESATPFRHASLISLKQMQERSFNFSLVNQVITNTTYE